jgi:hypothetical protein
MDVIETVVAGPWPFWLSGLCIGLFVPLLALSTGKALGISSAYAEVCTLAKPAGAERWKLWFALGLPLGGLAATLAAGGVSASGQVATLAGLGVPAGAQLALFAVGGGLLGYGARMAGGCHSGHAIMGCSIGARSSFVATAGFMVGGFVATWALFALLGGAP